MTRLLLVSSNGTGMGHLTRLLAMARRASPGVDVHLASMSQAVTIAATQGVPYDYIPSVRDLGIGTRRWNAIFARRMDALLTRLRPDAVVFDGAYPYDGLLVAARRHPRVRTVWSRRPMWRAGAGAGQLLRAGAFDLVLEPGEVAAEADAGLTVGRGDATRVRPIVLLDEADLLDRAGARAELGLDPTRPAALVTLGAGTLDDITSTLGAAVAGVRGLDGDVQICVTRPVIAGAEEALDDDVVALSAYPVSRYSRAFDFAVSAGGYNSVHESLAFALPTVFAPSPREVDDQVARCRWVADRGAAVLAGQPDAYAVVGDPAARARMAAACRALWPGNGAGDAIRIVEQLVAGGPRRAAP